MKSSNLNLMALEEKSRYHQSQQGEVIGINLLSTMNDFSSDQSVEPTNISIHTAMMLVWQFSQHYLKY